MIQCKEFLEYENVLREVNWKEFTAGLIHDNKGYVVDDNYLLKKGDKIIGIIHQYESGSYVVIYF